MKRHPAFRRVLFWVLCLSGIAMSIAWFALIAPMQRGVLYDTLVFDGQNNATWWEAHRRGARIMWQHDDFSHVGENASKEDVPWIIARGSAGHQFNSCSGGHRATALAIITNQNAGDTKEAWMQWWDSHNDHTQAEWILKGFEDSGVKVSLPLDHETAVALLTRIGHGTYSPLAGPRHREVPRNTRSNALRLLRDIEFSPEEITAQEIAADTTGDLLKGLLEYQSWRDSHPVRNGVGVVFAREQGLDRVRPIWTVTPFLLAWWGIAAVCVLVGVRGLRRMRPDVRSPPQVPPQT